MSPKKVCPNCGKTLILRNGKKGQFWGCTGFPMCRFTKDFNPNEAAEQEQASKFAPSKYQQTVFDFIKTGSGNAFVEAVAGSGKTTTIVQALKFTAGKVAFFAFNKSIANELSKKAPFHVQVSTLHSHGNSCLQKALPAKPMLDEYKKDGIAQELLPDLEVGLNIVGNMNSVKSTSLVHSNKSADNKYARSILVNLAALVQNTLTDATDRDAVIGLIEHYGLETNGCEDQVLELLPEMIQRCAERTQVIDFDDMIWLPVYLNLPITRYDWVFVDESQDLNQAQIQLVLRSLNQKGRIVCVGDRNQSIYGFRGADVQAVDNLVEATNAALLPLSITYRCPISHVKLARQLVPHLEHSDTAKQGEVNYNVPQHKAMVEMKSGDMVLCRLNAPLVKICYALIRSGKKAVIRGRDIGKGLMQLVDKMKAANITELVGKLEEYRRNELAKLYKKNAREASITALNDRVDTLIELTDGISNLSELRARIETIFSDKEEGIVCSSVHRAKGLESDSVYIIEPQLMPFPKATKEWEIEQERNILYVCVTRSKNRLTFIDGYPTLAVNEIELQVADLLGDTERVLTQDDIKHVK